MKPKAVIFDCDGTLVDSVGLANDVLVEYLAELGIAMSVQACTARFGSGKLADDIARFESESNFQLPGTFQDELRRRREVAFHQRLRPVEGVIDVLRAIRVPTCVASNGSLKQTQLSLALVGLLEHFQGRVFSAYDVHAWKPHPGLFLHAALALRVQPEECAVVEDSETGIQAGLAAGMRVFAYSKSGASEGRSGVHHVRHMAELIAHLGGAA